MSRTLVLMRHGKAQRPKEGQPDEQRQLTDYGARALVARLPHDVRMMPKGASVQLWTSPAVRAEQTARLVQKACKQAGINVFPQVELVDALWDQCFDEVIELVRACQADIGFAVGHNPFVEDAIAALTGSRIVFCTGAFCAVELPSSQGRALDPAAIEDLPEAKGAAKDAVCSNDAFPARLLWFMQGPISQRWKTLVHMEQVLEKAGKAVKERRNAFFDDPDDIETMHKFRVSIRTIRSLIAFVAPWQQAGQNKLCQANMKRIVGETSWLRELDVLAANAADMEGASPELCKFCSQHATEERRRVAKVLSSRQMKKLLDDTIRELGHIRWRKSVEAHGMDAGQVRARFDALTDRLEKQLAVLDLANEELTHDVRKNAKRVRYDAEQFKQLLGDDAVQIAKGMTAHQDDLGAICDARANIRIVSSFEGPDNSEQVAWGLALLRAQNETLLYTTLRGRGADTAHKQESEGDPRDVPNAAQSRS
ncbi:MAG: CHAD domain-containing protein [Eggerthellaceae bacterium]|nr:CHAD domain-containing protein [Eggerthellaceae bacterium]